MSFFDSTIGSIKSKISVDSKVNTSQNKYVVHSGDNLYRIAQNNNTTVDKLVELNNIDNPEVIDINQEIILPDKIITSETENTNDIYTVKNGDTLSKIAKENNTTVDELVRLNNIEDKDYIESGQQIKISQESITHSNNESNVISNNSTTNTETNQNISSSSSSTNIKNSGSIGNNSSQSSAGVASKTVGQFVNKIGDTIGNFANNVQQLFDNFSEEISGEYKYDDQIGTIEEINLTADVDANVEKYNLFDLSWVRETDEFLINLLAQKTGQSEEYISTLFNYALDNGYFLSFAPVDLGNGNIQNVFTITDPYVLNSKGKSQQYICVEEKTDENGNKFYSKIPNEEGFKQWVDEIKNIQNSTLNTKKDEKNKCVGHDILLKNIEGFANNIEKYINELSDKPLFYFQNIKGTLVNIVQEIKFLSNNMQQEQAKNLENDANKIFNYFEKEVIPLADNISDDAKNELSHIKNSFFQLVDSLSKKKNIIGNNSNNVEAKEYTIPDINVDTATSNMSEKESYIYYTKIMKNVLSQNNIQIKEDSTIFETVILFKDFITNNSSNLSESEIQNMTNFYNAILEEQVILLQTDKEIFTDFVNYLDISDKQKEELYTEFERGNGIGAVTISQIWSLDEEIKKLEKKKYVQTKKDAPWGGKMVVEEEDKEVSQQIQKLTDERYALSTQYKKQQFDYVINLRSSEEYKDATNQEIPKYINSNGDECEINIELLETQILSGQFQPAEIFSNIDGNLGQDKILEILEYLYEDVDFKNKILNGETATRENFFQHCFPSSDIDLQSKALITYRIFTIMDDSQISDLIYLSKVEGSDRALQYIYSLEDDANKYYGQKKAEEEFNKILSGESTVEEVLKAFEISTVDGVQGFFNNLYITFSKDTTTTAQQYATQYFLQTITMSSMFVELDDNSIQELLENKENPLDPEIATYLKTLEHPTELDILLKTGQITEEDYNFYLKLKDTEPYKKYIEELTNKSSQNKACIKYAYNVGLNVGNMLPSIASSAVFSIAGAPSVGQNIASLLMFGGAYGSAYQQGIRAAGIVYPE